MTLDEDGTRLVEAIARLTLGPRDTSKDFRPLLLGNTTQALLPELPFVQPVIYGWFDEADRCNLNRAVAAIAADVMQLDAVPQCFRAEVVERLLTRITLCEDDYKTLLSLLPPEKITLDLVSICAIR